MKTKIKFFIILILIIIIMAIISSTLSRYSSEKNGNINAPVSYWNIKINNIDITSGDNAAEFQNVLTPTIIPSEDVEPGKIAPESVGYVDLIIDTSNVQVSYNVSAILTEVQNESNNIIFYKGGITYDEYYDESIADEGFADPSMGIMGYSASFTYTGSPFDIYTIRFYFTWTNGSSDDTELGHSSALQNTTLPEFNVKVTFNQKA